MKINLGKFGTSSFDFQTEKLGVFKIAVLIFDTRFKIIEKIETDYADPTALTKFLISQLAYRKDENHEELINSNEINLLTENDLELFAKLFIENNFNLLSVYTPSKNPSPKESPGNKIEIVTNRIDFKKKSDENYKEYLYRFFKKYLELQFEEAKKNFGHIESLYNDSSTLKSLLNQNFEITSSLKDTFEDSLYPFSRYEFPITKSHTEITNDKLSELSSVILNLSEVSKRSYSLFTNINNIILNLLAEAKRNVKISSRFNYIIICIAIVSLLLTTIFSYKNLQYSNSASKQLQGSIERLIEISDKQLLLSTENERMNILLKKLNELLNKYSSSNSRDQQTILDSIKLINKKLLE